ncbi:hypothetical protein [Emticicia sp. C21]|uniref:hypothetical protein n=1 Tax=Emticicia sp. C21 TaxID=2302915 RepID=UPI000E340C1D|nr:hypothetical protein [Emticicia sp. C21]RFS16749.1 hypothetical protein D0T08_08695 [Emticicia sp. C21]
MEHKLDNFFRRKIDDVEDSLSENSAFDEELFWNSLQKNLDRPQRKGWWRWVAVAACLGGLVLWVVSISKKTPKTPLIIHELRSEPIPVLAIVPQKIKPTKPKLKKKAIIEPKKELEIEVEQLAVKVNTSPMQTPAIKQDSIYFKPLIVAEAKPQFKTIHVNEISTSEKPPIPQPKFKIRFAARSQN